MREVGRWRNLRKRKTRKPVKSVAATRDCRMEDTRDHIDLPEQNSNKHGLPCSLKTNETEIK